ncbi:hypothetical protein, partial [Bradyrhizobium sp.]|uniref:hypothetical protein n=1 Tax=Bradyrhizobium sp. TaxID=376 RepID=UPI003C4A376E
GAVVRENKHAKGSGRNRGSHFVTLGRQRRQTAFDLCGFVVSGDCDNRVWMIIMPIDVCGTHG